MGKDKKGNRYWEVPLGWNESTNDRIRITEIKKGNTIRFNKVDSNNKVYSGPEPTLEKIPEIIEILNQIYSENLD